jgi:hypothetical protein
VPKKEEPRKVIKSGWWEHPKAREAQIHHTSFVHWYMEGNEYLLYSTAKFWGDIIKELQDARYWKFVIYLVKGKSLEWNPNTSPPVSGVEEAYEIDRGHDYYQRRNEVSKTIQTFRHAIEAENPLPPTRKARVSNKALLKRLLGNFRATKIEVSDLT